MPTITCDTTATDDDGNVHAVVFHPYGGRIIDAYASLDIGDPITMVDQASRVESTGTLASFEATRDVENPTATRVELVITPD